MASDARKQLFMKHKEAWAKYAEQAIGKKVFYLEGSLNVRGEFCAIFPLETVRLFASRCSTCRQREDRRSPYPGRCIRNRRIVSWHLL